MAASGPECIRPEHTLCLSREEAAGFDQTKRADSTRSPPSIAFQGKAAPQLMTSVNDDCAVNALFVESVPENVMV